MKYKVVETQYSPIELKEFVAKDTGETIQLMKFTLFRRGDGFIPVVCYKKELWEFIKKDNEIEVLEWRPRQTSYTASNGLKRTSFQMILDKFVLANENEVQAQEAIDIVKVVQERFHNKPQEQTEDKKSFADMSDEEFDAMFGE